MSWSERLTGALRDVWLCLLGWIPTPVGTALRWVCWAPLFASCGRVRFGTGVDMAGMRNMRLADGVRVGRHCFLSAQHGRLELGGRVALSPCVHVCADDGVIVIGAHTAIGMNTVLRAANHRTDRLDVPMMDQGHVPGVITIEEDVWIGAGCVITPDVTIGRGAVVGAGAVVTRDVAPMTVVGGVPARVIGRRDGSGAPDAPREDVKCL